MNIELLSILFNFLFMILIILIMTYNINSILNRFIQPGSRWLILCCILFSAWAALTTLMSIAPDRHTLYLLTNVFIVIPFLSAVSWFMFCYEFTFRRKVPRFMFISFPIAIAIFILGLINPYNIVYQVDIYSQNSLIPAQPNTIRFFFNVILGYGLVLTGVGIVISEYIRTENIKRDKHTKVLLLCTILTVLFSLPSLFSIQLYSFEPILLGLLSITLIISYAIYKYDFGYATSFSAEKIIKESNNIIILCNKNNSIVSMNKKANNLIGGHAIGDKVDKHIDINKETIEFSWDNKTHYFSIEVQEMSSHKNSGIAYILTDITKIKKQEKEIEIYNKVINRVLRHNFRNDMNVIKGYSEAIIEEKEKTNMKDQARIINKKSRSLHKTIKKLRKIESVLTEDRLIEKNIVSEIENIIKNKKYHRNTQINSYVDINNYKVMVSPHIKYAIEEIIENSIVHNNSKNKKLNITVTDCESYICILFKDNGNGIDQHEIDVIESNNETSHKHGSGSGLWLINWIISKSNGEIIFKELKNGSYVEIKLLKS